MISDLTSTIREQDHALTTITQEKRALQLQLSRIGNAREHNSPVKGGLERISECTEPSRESRESSVCRDDNVFSSCSSENYSDNIISQRNSYDSQMEPLQNQNRFFENKSRPFEFDQEAGPSNSQLNQYCSELETIENQSFDDQLIDVFEDQIEPLIEEPDSPELNDINISPELSIIDDCDNNSDNFEDFEESSQNFIVTLPDNDKNNLLTVPFDSERSTYLSISPARSDATNCISIPSTPSPERSISFSKTSSNPEISEENYSGHDLQIPRTYYLSHSPDSIFPKEKMYLSRSKSLGAPLPKMHLFSRASSM